MLKIILRIVFFFTIKKSLSKMKLGDIMQRYFIEKKENNIFILSKDDSYHINTVMRMKLEDNIEIICDKKLYISKIIELNPLVKAEIIREIEFNNELSTSVTIVQSSVKEQKMDYILQKTTELGVSEIVPYMAARSVVKLDNKQDKKIERWQKIVKEASEQSKRNYIPVVRNAVTLSNLVNLSDYDMKFLCTVNESSQNIKKVLSNLDRNGRMLFVIGPEGGFTEEEETKMIENGFISLSLGSSVLRTETASTFIMSVIRYLDME